MSKKDLFDWNAPVPIQTIRRERIQASRGLKKKSGSKAKRILSKEDRDEIVRGVMRGDYLGKSLDVAPGKIGTYEAQEVASHYAHAHAKYFGHRVVNWRSRLQSSPGVLGCFLKAAITADMCKVSAESFVASQFWWFDQVYGKAPRIQDLAGPNSKLRVEQWKEKKDNGGVARNIVHRASHGFVKQNKEELALLEYEASVLQRMIERWGSERQVWEIFGDPSDEDVFSNVFKRSRSIWVGLYTDQDVTPHQWEPLRTKGSFGKKSAMVSEPVICRVCGIQGRKDYTGQVIRDRKHQDDKYEYCSEE